jgi:hypothetical protein
MCIGAAFTIHSYPPEFNYTINNLNKGAGRRTKRKVKGCSFGQSAGQKLNKKYG